MQLADLALRQEGMEGRRLVEGRSDLRLKQKGITHVIVVGLLANTCIEATARYASELGYHVTLVRDATAAFKPEMMHAAHHLNGPTFAQEIRTTSEVIAALPQASR